MNKRLWYINAFLAVALSLCCVYGAYKMPEYPSNAKFDEKKINTRNAVSDNSESESPTVVSARGFSNWLDPPPSYGSIKLTIEPAEAVEAGAGWRVGGNAWLDSQALANSVTPGKKTITFKTVKGWVSPVLSVEVSKDQVTEAVATYTLPPQGYVKVNIEPEEVRNLNPQWQIDGSAWLNHGELSPRTAVGTHRITFKSVEGWDTPAMTVIIEDEKTAEISVEYKLIRYGYIDVKIPDTDQPKAVEWKIDNGQWLAFGVEPQKVRLGNYKVSFKPAEDWISPEAITVDVREEKSYSIEKSYTRIPYAQLKIQIFPENDERIGSAQWKLDNGPWKNSGELESKVSMGRHTVTFKDVAGWHTPVKTEIEVSEEVMYLLNSEYERIRPAGPTFAIRSVIETGGGRGIAFTSPTTGFRIGEEIDGFLLTHIEYGKVRLEKEGFEYELDVVEKPAPQQVLNQNQPVARPGNPRPGVQPQPGQEQPTREQMEEMQRQRQSQFQQPQLEQRGMMGGGMGMGMGGMGMGGGRGGQGGRGGGGR